MKKVITIIIFMLLTSVVLANDIYIREQLTKGPSEDVKSIIFCDNELARTGKNNLNLDGKYNDNECTVYSYNNYYGGIKDFTNDQEKQTVNIQINTKSSNLIIPKINKENTFKIYSGWNLIPVMWSQASSGSCQADEHFSFFYNAPNQKYYRFGEKSSQEIFRQNEFEIFMSSMWTYSPIECELAFPERYDENQGSFSYKTIQFSKGWNIKPVTKDMYETSLRFMDSTCEFEKIALWNSKEQNWKKIDQYTVFKEDDTGMAVKVEDNCGFNLIEFLELDDYDTLWEDSDYQNGIMGGAIKYGKNNEEVGKVYLLIGTEPAIKKVFEDKVEQPALKETIQGHKIYSSKFEREKSRYWNHKGNIIFIIGDNEDIINYYLTAYPPTEEINYIDLLPSAPSFEEI